MKADKAARLISEGNLDFILRARPSRLSELLFLHSGAAFYAGLLVEDRSAALNAEADIKIAGELYQVSLESPSSLIREAALQRLVPLLLKAGEEDAARQLIPETWTGNWKEIFNLTAAPPSAAPGTNETAGRKLAVFFMSAPLDEAYIWGWTASDKGLFTGAENAAITGRLAASRSSFAEAITAFRETLEQDETLFLRYPALLNDLGRTFQFSAALDEGSALFQEWEKRLSGGILGDAARETTYLLPYFAGRMERQAGRYGEAVEIFTRALAAAPDDVQEDACMWYILNVIQSGSPESFIPMLKTYIPRWHNISNFEDILERQARYLTANRQWDALFEIYSLFPAGAGLAARGQYAYILGRAVSLGFYGGVSPGKEDASSLAASFFQAARDEPAASFYYRALAGRFLDAPPIAIPKARAYGITKEETAVFQGAEIVDPSPLDSAPAEFLLGFFEYGVGGHIAPYLQNLREKLADEELRELVKAFSAAERWSDAIRLMAFLMGRKDYEFTRQDLELSFPQPFRDLVETYARETDIPAHLLYGLIRTESAFDPEIHSRSGAAGLTQLMTATALDMADRLGRRGGPQYAENGEINLKDPETNIHLGAVYLAYLMNNLKNPMIAILAYNGGLGRVRRWLAGSGENLFPEDIFAETIEISETREYGRKVLGAAAVYGYLYYGVSMEDIVADIIK
ncbi:MAG: lytic transglycosylase domain-containing protein [Treponema sp.]|jgi:soluble lytic murein transglycosylase|nr:lytic transglycosylase domain-containing protein [Treponema sp.]